MNFLLIWDYFLSRKFRSWQAGRSSLERSPVETCLAGLTAHDQASAVDKLTQRPSSQPVQRKANLWRGWMAIVLLGGFLSGSSAEAAERLTLRVGPVRQSVAIADLTYFAETGNAPPSMQLLAPVLTEDMQQAFNERLYIDPSVSEKLMTDLLDSPAGERLLDTLKIAIPNAAESDIRDALVIAAQNEQGISLLGVLQTFPTETVTVDMVAAIALISQMNLSYWQSQALRSTMVRELTVELDEPFHGAFDPTASGHQPFTRQTLNLEDEERDRIIPVDLYWSDRTQGPLIVLSHGFAADRRFLDYLAEHFASYGLSVASVEHSGSNVAWLNGLAIGESEARGRLGEILPASEFVDRPQDVSFVLDELAYLNEVSYILGGHLNTEDVVVIGHSLGGYTALALAGAPLNLTYLREFCENPGHVALSPADWLQCGAVELEGDQIDLRDRRVSQAIAFNPAIGRLFDETSLANINVPTLVLAGTSDTIAPAVSQQLLPFSYLRSPRYLITAIGGTHLSVGDPTNLNHALTSSVFTQELPGPETEKLRQMVEGISLAFVKQLTPEADLYAPFLSSAYVQSFSSADVRIRLNRELPDSLLSWLQVGVVPLEQLLSSTLPKHRHHRSAELLCQDNDPLCNVGQLHLLMFIVPGASSLTAYQFLRRGRRWQRMSDRLDRRYFW